MSYKYCSLKVNILIISTSYVVYPRTPEDVKCTDIKPHSVKLCWEQIYRCDDEKPTEYLVKIVGKPNMSGPITPIVCEILSAKYRYKCEHILKSLEPGNTYTLVITAKIGDYAKHSAEVVIATTRKSITNAHYV